MQQPLFEAAISLHARDDNRCCYDVAPVPSMGGNMTDPRVAEIVAQTIGIDTHNHIGVPLTAAEMPGPEINLAGEMKRSGLDRLME
jgi:membrane dipeptidase